MILKNIFRKKCVLPSYRPTKCVFQSTSVLNNFRLSSYISITYNKYNIDIEYVGR